MGIKRLIVSDYRYQVGIVILMVIFVVSVRGYATRDVEYTNNATVQCDLIDVVSEVNGVIEHVGFEDDQWVDAKDVLIQIEKKLFDAGLNRAISQLSISKSNYEEAINSEALLRIDLDANLKKAKTELASEKALFSSTDSAIVEATKEMEAIEADIVYLEDNYHHISKLYKDKAVSEQDYKNAKRQYESRSSMYEAMAAKVKRLTSAREAERNKVLNAEESLQTLILSKDALLDNAAMKVKMAKAEVGVSQAEFDLASLNLERTKIRAKRSGYISNRRTSSGDYIEVGQPIASIVSCQDSPWIQANFKETQVGKMKRGQKVTFTIDTYPQHKFEGELQSISSGSGSIFSVLPPENASGNFTKVVKRMPVKISIIDSHDAVFRIGASASVKVFTNEY